MRNPITSTPYAQRGAVKSPLFLSRISVKVRLSHDYFHPVLPTWCGQVTTTFPSPEPWCRNRCRVDGLVLVARCGRLVIVVIRPIQIRSLLTIGPTVAPCAGC